MDSTKRKKVNRETWDNAGQFFLSMMGYCVGLGSIWRFPYLVMKNGGGAFLIPFLIYLLMCGIPLYYAEVILGQYSGLSVTKCFNYSPFFNGIGWSMLFIAILCMYYNLLLAYIIYYLVNSFTMPWTTCNNTWNTENCFEYKEISVNSSLIRAINVKTNLLANFSTDRSAATEFWYFNTLEITNDPMSMGSFNWKIFLCLIAAWGITFVCVWRGIKSTGKAVYVTSTAPYVLLTILLIRGATLPGAALGIKYYIQPDWSKLLNIEIWSSAGSQIFYSLGPTWGALIAMSSYNKVNHNIKRDSLLLPALCCLTSVYAGFTIYSVIGYIAYSLELDDLSKLNLETFGLVFITYPEALNRLPVPQFWSVCFFLMLLTVGLDSQFCSLESLIAGLCDMNPEYLQGKRKTWLIFGICLFAFFTEIPLCFQGGSYLFHILDFYSTPIVGVIIGICEVISFAYFYDGKKLISHVSEMVSPTSRVSKMYWYSCWYFLTPVFIIPVLIASVYGAFGKLTNHLNIPYPSYSPAIGLTVAFLAFLPIPTMMLKALYENRGDLKQAFKPNEFWKNHIEDRHGNNSGIDATIDDISTIQNKVLLHEDF